MWCKLVLGLFTFIPNHVASEARFIGSIGRAECAQRVVGFLPGMVVVAELGKRL